MGPLKDGSGVTLQAIRFLKSDWPDVAEQTAWLSKYGYRSNTSKETATEFIYEQRDASLFEELHGQRRAPLNFPSPPPGR